MQKALSSNEIMSSITISCDSLVIEPDYYAYFFKKILTNDQYCFLRLNYRSENVIWLSSFYCDKLITNCKPYALMIISVMILMNWVRKYVSDNIMLITPIPVNVLSKRPSWLTIRLNLTKFRWDVLARLAYKDDNIPHLNCYYFWIGFSREDSALNWDDNKILVVI
jgi:hypothetical protein